MKASYFFVAILVLLVTIIATNQAHAPQIGDEVTLKKGVLVNPRDWGTQSWLITQPDTCDLHPGQAIVRDVDKNMLFLEQGSCRGWAPKTRVQW